MLMRLCTDAIKVWGSPLMAERLFSAKLCKSFANASSHGLVIACCLYRVSANITYKFGSRFSAEELLEMLKVVRNATAVVAGATMPPYVQCWHYNAAGAKTQVVCNELSGTEACATNGTVSTHILACSNGNHRARHMLIVGTFCWRALSKVWQTLHCLARPCAIDASIMHVARPQ
jgi:hypothetical protein